jgi:hypothetical protein
MAEHSLLLVGDMHLYILTAVLYDVQYTSVCPHINLPHFSGTYWLLVSN